MIDDGMIEAQKEVSDIEILTSEGFVKISKVFKTKKLKTMTVTTETGKSLTCSGKHILLKYNGESFDEIFCKDLNDGDYILTKNGNEKITKIEEAFEQHCYDVTVDNDEHLYLTNDIVSHNSGVGKSFISGMAIKNAQEMGYTVVYYDSENAVDNEFMERIGVDTTKMLYFPIDVVEEFRNHAINTCKQFLDENPEEKIMIVLDSFGNLSCAKEKRDLESGKDNSDMGCFVPDTLIKVNGGVKRIQDIKEGDVVVTHLNRERKVTELFKYEDKKIKKKFVVDGGELETTLAHKLLVYCAEEKQLVWKKAERITTNDKLVKIKK